MSESHIHHETGHLLYQNPFQSFHTVILSHRQNTNKTDLSRLHLSSEMTQWGRGRKVHLKCRNGSTSPFESLAGLEQQHLRSLPDYESGLMLH